MEIPIFKELNCTTCSERYIKKHYSEFYEMLKTMYSDADTFGEKLYRYFNNIDIRPTCSCGAHVPFLSITKGFQRSCSVKCSTNTEEYKTIRKRINNSRSDEEKAAIRERVRKTNLERYGVDNPRKSAEVKEKIHNTLIQRYGGHGFSSETILNKVKETNLERYGSEWTSSVTSIKDKIHLTNLERYGGTGFGSEELQQKVKDTLISRYGVDNINKSNIIKRKIENTFKKRTFEIDNNILEILYDESGSKMFKIKCPNSQCNLCKDKFFITYSGVYRNRKSSGIDICTISNPLNTITGTSIERFITDILDKYNITYQTNIRTILDGKELDIYIPDKNIAIECNGIFWHDSIHKPKSYHYDKFCRCRDKGIQLISIWEDQVVLFPEKVESLILSKLGIYTNRIFARNCEIKKISSELLSNFLTKYHMQGCSNSSIRYGLFYNNELISVMSFGKTRNIYKNNIIQEGEYELYRYCCKSGYQIIGGAEKLLTHFIRDYSPVRIISFASNDISTGDLYYKLGFLKVSEQSNSYWYINHVTNERFHRFTFTKSKLVSEGYSSDLTEEQIMYSRGYLKIYDSGITKFTLSIK